MLSKAQIKIIHSLRHKKYRQKSGLFLAEGIKVVDELLKENHIRPDRIYALEPWLINHAGLRQTHPEITVVPVTEQELKQVSGLDTPRQVLAVCRIPAGEQVPGLQGKITLMTEAIRDPGNLGTLIRIADWFGIERVICSPDCADAFNPKTVQATMGSLARVKVTEAPLEEILRKNKTVPVYAATLHGRPVTAYAPVKEGIILIGNESAGLSEEMTRAATHRITIPRIGGAESLNAAVAAGIICSRLIL